LVRSDSQLLALHLEFFLQLVKFYH
jgi:hypothetical protein